MRHKMAIRQALRCSMALAALAFVVESPAATLGGRLSYPSEEIPAMTIVARNAAGTTFTTETRVRQTRYQLTVPAGTYVVYAIPQGIGAKPGETGPRGAHTAYSICSRDKALLYAGKCKTGPLVEIRLAEADRREDVDVDDWYLPAVLEATLTVPAPGQAKAAK